MTSYAGIWLSRYEYFSSSRNATFTSEHHVLVEEDGDLLTVNSVSGSADSDLWMTLAVQGGVATGTWTENTDPDGYYHGARYDGALRLEVDAGGRYMTGKWIGFGRNGEANTGPWTLELLEVSTA